ncbi:cupin domain-containing protein [Kitasatospora sp. NPDC001540]|uniref:cupin domain-containing protein n=1 Tax=Kitasatospora sp. NPDC001540 TaxID=3364014 RepID=UPI0036B65C06
MNDERFFVLQPNENRPTEVPLPPGFGVKAATTDTEGRVAILVNQLDIDVPLHVHEQMDEFVHVLDGAMEIDYRGRTYRLDTGMCALLPRGVPHAMRNASQPPARCLQVSTPGGWDQYLEDVFAAGSALRTADGRLDLAEVNRIGAPYGMRYIPATMAMPDHDS